MGTAALLLCSERSPIQWTGKSSRLCRRLLSVGIKLVSEISGYLIADFRMTLDTIVEHLDVFKGHLPGLLTGGKAIVMQAFPFERAKSSPSAH